MRLRLVLKGPQRLAEAERERILETGGIVIGRSVDADWSIPDPERILSKAHCRIEKDDNRFVLTDTSTNGVRINDEPVGFGLSRMLENGDVIKLGDAVIVAAIDGRESAEFEGQESIKVLEIPDGPFGDDNAVFANTEPLAAANESRPQSPAPAEPVLDDWWERESETAPGADLKSVDILPKENGVAKQDINATKELLGSPSGGVASVVRLGGDLNLNTFARAVDSAALVLTESERQKFHGRLLEILRDSDEGRI